MIRQLDKLLKEEYTLVMNDGRKVVPIIAVPKLRMRWMEQMEHASMDSRDKVILPAMGIVRSYSSEIDETMLCNSNRYVLYEYSTDKNSVQVAKFPVWRRMTVQIDFLSKTIADGNEFCEWLWDKHRGMVIHRHIEDKLKGKYVISFTLDNIVDNSELEGEDIERLIRLTASLTLSFPVQFTPDMVKTVRKIKFRQFSGDEKNSIYLEEFIEEL